MNARRSLVDVGTSRPGSTLAVRVAVPTAVARLLQWPLRYGRQFSHNFPDFLHEQFIQRPLLFNTAAAYRVLRPSSKQTCCRHLYPLLSRCQVCAWPTLHVGSVDSPSSCTSLSADARLCGGFSGLRA